MLVVLSLLQHCHQVGAQRIPDGLGGARRVLIVRLRFGLLQVVLPGAGVRVPLEEKGVAALLAQVVQDAARRHHLGQHGPVHLAPSQQVAPAPPQAGKGGVDNGLSRGKAAIKAPLVAGESALAVRFHQPWSEREGRVADEVHWYLHSLEHCGFL